MKHTKLDKLRNQDIESYSTSEVGSITKYVSSDRNKVALYIKRGEVKTNKS